MSDGRFAGAVAPGDRLVGAVALVTGAGRGLGLAIAERLAAEGALVAALDVRPAVAADAVDAAGPAGPAARAAPAATGTVVPVRCDVTDPDAVRLAVAEVVDRWGGVDVLVNNAGLLSGRASLLTATPEQLHRFFAVNAVGALLMVQAAFPYLRESARRGRVINVASRTFFTGSPGQLGAGDPGRRRRRPAGRDGRLPHVPGRCARHRPDAGLRRRRPAALSGRRRRRPLRPGAARGSSPHTPVSPRRPR